FYNSDTIIKLKGNQMAKLINNYNNHNIILDFNFVKNDLFICEKDQEQYLNWLPVEVSLKAGSNVYEFSRTPTFSLESVVEYFIPTLENLLNENEKLQQSFVE